MIVLLHVLTAFLSIIHTTYAYYRPMKRTFYASYSLVAATIASGAYLVISTHAPLAASCTTGLLYLGVVSIALVGGRRKLTN